MSMLQTIGRLFNKVFLLTSYDYFTAQLPRLDYSHGNLSSAQTSIPTNPRTDEFNFQIWEDFETLVNEWVAFVGFRFFSPLINDVPDTIRVYNEEGVKLEFKEAAGTLVSKFFIFLNRLKCSFIPSGQISALNSDLVLVESVRNIDVLKMVMEFKTPWAFPVNANTNLVDLHRNEIELFRAKNPLKPSRANPQPLPHSDSRILAVAVTERKDETKVIRAVAQLYAYMSVNHLRYGILSTYEWTFFFRRVQRAEEEKPILEVSNPIPQLSVVKSLLFMAALALEDHQYSSPYHTPPLNRREPVPKETPSVPTELSLDNFKFDRPVIFGRSSTIVRSLLDRRRETIYKIWDSSKNPDNYEFFKKEIKIYELGRRLQGNVIPILKGSYIASGFVLVLQLSDCGRRFTDKQELLLHKREVLAAFNALHMEGIIHGDVADRNLVLGPGNVVRIVDFELSRSKDEMSEEEWDEMLHRENNTINSLFP